MKTPEPIGQQGRWLDLIGEFQISIQHRPGRVHGNSDALSRRPCDREYQPVCSQCRWVASDDIDGTGGCSRREEVMTRPETVGPQSLSDQFVDADRPVLSVRPVSNDNPTADTSENIDNHSSTEGDDNGEEEPGIAEDNTECVPITLDNIRVGQLADDSIGPVLQLVKDGVEPSTANLRLPGGPTKVKPTYIFVCKI